MSSRPIGVQVTVQLVGQKIAKNINRKIYRPLSEKYTVKNRKMVTLTII